MDDKRKIDVNKNEKKKARKITVQSKKKDESKRKIRPLQNGDLQEIYLLTQELISLNLNSQER